MGRTGVRAASDSLAQNAQAFALAGFALVTILRFVVANPIEGVGFLYVIPISIVAVQYGLAGGLGGTACASGLTVVWAIGQSVELGPGGYASLFVSFLAVGVVVGLLSEGRRQLENERDELFADLQEAARADQLTGLPNRRAWDEQIERELQRNRRLGGQVSIAILDLDGLKTVNDSAGHEAGDRLLRSCAAAWRQAARGSDFLARLGGDEFAMLLPGTDAEKAEAAAARILAHTPKGHSCSAGVACWEGGETPEDLTRRADEALYAAKRAGGGHARVALEAVGLPG